MRVHDRPDSFEAFQFTGEPHNPGWPEFWLTVDHSFKRGVVQFTMVMNCETGTVETNPLDFVIKKATGVYESCPAELFEKYFVKE